MIFNQKHGSRQIVVQRSEEENMLWLQMGLDLDSRSFELRGSVDDNMTAFALRCLTKLTAENHDPITIFLNSPGGSAPDGFAIYDLIESCPCHVTIVGMGQICSMAPIIMLAGDVRIALPNTTFMVHAPLFTRERETSVDTHLDDAREGLGCKKMMLKILAKKTNKPIEWWNAKITKQDYNFNCKQAEEYGILTPTIKDKVNVRSKATRVKIRRGQAKAKSNT